MLSFKRDRRGLYKRKEREREEREEEERDRLRE
jgi:hypothetical protein